MGKKKDKKAAVQETEPLSGKTPGDKFLDAEIEKGKEKKKKAESNKALIAVILILFLVMGVCTYKITGKLLDYKYSSDVYDKYAETFASVKTEETVEGSQKQEEKSNKYDWGMPEDTDVVYDAIEDDGKFPVEVNFDELMAENTDVVGWLYLEGTKINYPVVKGVDNDYYLHRLINGHYSYGGTLFLDASCRRDWSSRNNIIYGHNMNDGSMFRPLIAYKKQEYVDEHPYLYLATPKGNYRLDIFAGIITESEAEVFSTVFPSNESFNTWYKKMMEKSVIKTGIEPNENSRIVSMSTCTYEKPDMRFVVMAVMRPIVPAETPAEVVMPAETTEIQKTEETGN